MQVIVSGLAVVLSAMIGAVVMFYVNTILRKEKFKEIIYKERLSAYKEIAELGFKVWYRCLQLSLDYEKMKDLTADTARLEESADKNYLLLSGCVNNELGKFMSIVTDTCVILRELPKQEIGDIVKKEHPTRTVESGFYRIVNQMRKELGIETLSEDTIKTFQFGIREIKR